jgi:hypothetical protein
MVSDFGAGFASGVSGGYLTDVYEYYTGNRIEPLHGLLWNVGNIAGISTAFLLGMKLPAFAATAVGTMRWVAVAGTGLDVGLNLYGAATATRNLVNSYQDNGQWEWQDAWNLLSYVPFFGMSRGVKKGLGTAGEVKTSAPGMDVDVRATSKTITEVGGNPRCFVAGTEILTSEGEKNIENIQVGDWVLADDPNTPGEIEYKQVTDTFVRHTDKLVDLYIDGEVISTTGEHPFWTPDKGWVEAKDLTVGSLVQTEDGRIIDVDKIEKREGDFTVYNFKVDGFHTYFVSDLGVLVHNAGCGPVAGVIEVSPRTSSVGALKNYKPKSGFIEFIYDPETDSFFVGLPKSRLNPMDSPHQSIVRASGANPKTVVGGMFSRSPDGTIRTNEYSGHYGERWNDHIRQKFVNFLEEKTGIKVDHELWS